MRQLRRPLAAAGTLAVVGAMVVTATGATAQEPDPTAQPTTIPAVQQYTAGQTAWRPGSSTRVLVPTADAQALVDDAQTLADELESEAGLDRVEVVVTDETPAPGDIVLTIGDVDGTGSHEAYRLEAGETVQIVGPTDTGVFWGTRTLLQALRTEGGIGGVVVDEPGYGQRGLMVDVGRKYFTPEWLEERIRELSWLKMNTLHLHLSDNLGFRVELDSHPGIVDEPALTKEDVAHLVEVAEQYHVTLIPEVDSPGHLDAALDTRPDLQLVRADGSVYAGHLDYSKPEARQFMKDIVGEIADMFPGPWFHLGGDEYYGAPWQPPAEHVTAENSPQLIEYARAATGEEDATLLDGFDAYMNELVDLLAEDGKRAKMWNDHIEPGEGVIDVDKSVQVEVWIRWRDWLPSAVDFIDAGYDIVNAHGDHLYFILTEGGRNETGKKSPSGLYELWTPRTYMLLPGEDFILDEDLPMDGAHMSIWSDDPTNLTEEEVAQEAGLWFRSFAQNIWDSPKIAPTWEEFVPIIDAIGMPPVPNDAPEPTPSPTPTTEEPTTEEPTTAEPTDEPTTAVPTEEATTPVPAPDEEPPASGGSGQLPRTGADGAATGTLAALGLLAAGAAALAARRRARA